MKILFAIIGIIFAYGFYVNSAYYIKNQDWKYGEGTSIGDWLGQNSFEIENSTIKTNRETVRIIFSYGRKLIIENIETKERGLYFNKS
ncbi:hypothetical protein [Tenacibaculum sp. 190130A14a]|uniref:Uncharacterized protein n=1 Tax=Tenacibaculum polynesiense TaxID=3137857 RepID=A0ABP1F0Z9_9FLAO